MVTRILIVDDEEDIEPLFRQGLRSEIRTGRIEVSFARGAEPALDMIATDASYDTIISDLNMPGMGGMKFLRRLAEAYPDLSVAVVTANADNRTREKVEELGVSGFFSKPVDFSHIRRFIAA